MTLTRAVVMKLSSSATTRGVTRRTTANDLPDSGDERDRTGDHRDLCSINCDCAPPRCRGGPGENHDDHHGRLEHGRRCGSDGETKSEYGHDDVDDDGGANEGGGGGCGHGGRDLRSCTGSRACALGQT